MNTIIISALIVAAIGCIAGIILTIASKLMYVPVDERVAAVREVLPGANCGACGFAGCDDYANALGDDPTLSTTLCPVGGATVATQVSRILGVEAGEVEEKVATVMCGGTMGISEQIMKANRIHTCKSAKLFYGGPKPCPYGCIGLGDCAINCPYDAISVVNGVASVDRDKCVGCGICEDVCPNNIISVISKKARTYVACKNVEKGAVTRKICSAGCIGCKKCEKICKFEAIQVIDNFAHLDFSKCKNCGMCAKECPTGAIHFSKKQKNNQ